MKGKYLFKFTVDLMVGRSKVESFVTDNPKKLEKNLIKQKILFNPLKLKVTKN